MAHPNFAEAFEPEYLDSIANASVISATMGDTNLVVKNRGGATVADLLIKDPEASYVEQAVQLYSYDLGIRNALITDWTCQFYANDKIFNLASNPSARVTALAWSPDGVYLAIGVNTAPYVEVYKRSGDTLTKLTPAMTSAGSMVLALTWSADGQYLYTGQINGPFLVIYKRSGDTFTYLSAPSTMPPGYVTGLSYSDGPLSSVLSVGLGVYPYVYNYQQVGDNLSILAEPEFVPDQQINDLAWSPTGTYLAAINLDSDRPLFIYKRTSSLVFEKLPDLSGIGPGGTGYSVAWSPNERYLAFCGAPPGIGDPTFYVYKRSGDVFTKISNPSSFPAGNVLDVAWSPDSRYLAVSTDTAPFLTVYKLVNDVPVATLPLRIAPDAGGQLAWSPIGKHLTMINGSTAPYLVTYKSMLGPISGAAISMKVGDG